MQLATTGLSYWCVLQRARWQLHWPPSCNAAPASAARTMTIGEGLGRMPACLLRAEGHRHAPCRTRYRGNAEQASTASKCTALLAVVLCVAALTALLLKLVFSHYN